MRRIAFLILMFVGLSSAFAGDKAPVVARDSSSANFVHGVGSVTVHFAGGDLKVTVKTSKAADGLFKEGFRWGGEDAVSPLTLTTSIVVQSGAEKLFVPLSAYSDLGDPRRISLSANATGFELAIIGGDAGVAYNAVLVFEDGWLIRRRVTHGEFPDEAWEETKYAYNTLNN
ncbi:hypothetical protein [Stenotrophomonas daejeonensis]|uniref:hypothetical protein n=1 Tax=Stenotrophomonas daejeonensis TaxID=659018 RepID=UPI00128F615F|nr:hypothetical protein [Stenotrophomonas daejeonensis]